MKNIIFLSTILFSLNALSQPMLIRTEFKDENLSTCYTQELKRLITDYKVPGTFGYIKTIIKTNSNDFEETTSIYYKDEKGEVYDSMIEARYIPISEIQNSITNKFEVGFDPSGKNHFHGNVSIAAIFHSIKNDEVLLIKLLSDKPKDYGARINNKSYSSSYIVPLVWWYEKGMHMNKDELTNYLSTHFKKES